MHKAKRKVKREKQEKLIPVADQKVYVTVSAVVALHEECRSAYDSYMGTPRTTNRAERRERLDYCLGMMRALNILGLPTPEVAKNGLAGGRNDWCYD